MDKKSPTVDPNLESPSFEIRIRSLVNNEYLSDVVFLVGKEKVKIHAHKTILALGSPVFRSMFYADHGLRMQSNQPIEIPDITPVGFLNMLKQLYGHKARFPMFDLSEFNETYKAADKYLVYYFASSLIKQLEKYLYVSNCVIIYDQLMQLDAGNDLLTKSKTMIELYSAEAFKSKQFEKIGQDTLINLLKFKQLNITEFEILDACSRWVNAEVIRRGLSPTIENKRNVFKPIKPFIKYSDLSLEDLKKCKDIDDLLTYEEIGMLFVHSINSAKPLTIDCQTTRKKLELSVVFVVKNLLIYVETTEISGFLNVNRKVFIRLIGTYLYIDADRLQLTIFDSSGDELVSYEDGILLRGPMTQCSFVFNELFEVDANKDYRLVFRFIPARPGNMGRFDASNNMVLRYLKNDIQIDFKLRFEPLRFHIIEKIEFYVPS